MKSWKHKPRPVGIYFTFSHFRLTVLWSYQGENTVSVCQSVYVCVCMFVQSRMAKLIDQFWWNFQKIVSPRSRSVHLSFQRFGCIVTSWRPFRSKCGTTVCICVKGSLTKVLNWFWQFSSKNSFTLILYHILKFEQFGSHADVRKAICWVNGSNLWFCVFTRICWHICNTHFDKTFYNWF